MRRTPLPIIVSLSAALLLLGGCVTTWTYPTGPVASASKDYTVRLPEGWTYLPVEGGSALLSTYDGPLLQAIRISEYKLSDELPYSKEKLSSTLAAEDLGDALFQEYFKTPGVTGPTLESASPAQIDAIEGVEIVYSYSNEDGLRYRSIARAAIRKGKLYVINYSAPVRHYFERYDDKVGGTVDSFSFSNSAK